MTLHYRFASADDIGDVARLSAHSFPGPSRDAAWWEEQLQHPRYGGGAEIILLGQENGRTVASLQAHPLTQWISGNSLSVCGIGTVAMSPVHRRRRYAGELMTAALRAARERGDQASALYPFRVSFYQKLGYGQAGAALQYQIPPDMLPDSPERLRVELLGDSARSEALVLYHRWAQTQTGQVERTERIWNHLCSAPDRLLVAYRASDGSLNGYALVTYHPMRPQRYLEVDELVWLTSDARRGLYGWLASLSDQWEQIVLRALPSHGLGDWIREPRLPHSTAPHWGLWAPGATLMMGPMFRLLDLPNAWERRRIQEAQSLTVNLELTDQQITENDGSWRLRLENGRAAIDRSGSAELTLRTDVSTLSRLYIASLSPTAALEANLLECDRPELLSRLGAALALPEPWMFDKF